MATSSRSTRFSGRRPGSRSRRIVVSLSDDQAVAERQKDRRARPYLLTSREGFVVQSNRSDPFNLQGHLGSAAGGAAQVVVF